MFKKFQSIAEVLFMHFHSHLHNFMTLSLFGFHALLVKEEKLIGCYYAIYPFNS